MSDDPQTLRCLVIHLARAKQRAANVEVLIRDLPCQTEVISAVDGASDPAAIAGYYVRSLLSPRYPFALRPAEVATFLSHRKCWQYIVDQGLEAALIVEDDVALAEPTFRKALSLAMDHLRQGDVIRFPIKPREVSALDVARSDDSHLFMPKEIGLGMQCQIVSKEAAERLLSLTERFDRPVDTYLQLVWEHQVRILTVWPSGISEISEGLGGSLIGQRMSLGRKLRQEILRPIYRARLRRRAKIWIGRD